MSVIMPGSYDPVTLGHIEMIKEVARKEKEVYVVIFENPNKTYRFSLSDRVRMLLIATEGLENVTVSYSLGRVVDYMREHGISEIVKGYRNDTDLAWETEQAEYNMKHGGYETRLIKCLPEYEHISSSAVRYALDNNESTKGLLDKRVYDYIKNIR